MGGVPIFKVFDNAKCMQVVVETQAVLPQAFIESAFACVAKGRMANVMHQRECLNQFFIQAERTCHFTRDLHDLNGVRQA